MICTPCEANQSTASCSCAVELTDARNNGASGAISWITSATPTPWGLLSFHTAHGCGRQNVPAGAGTSPAAWAVSHADWLNESTIPTRTPVPVNPAACHASAFVLAISSPTTGEPASCVDEAASLNGVLLTSSGGRT